MDFYCSVAVVLVVISGSFGKNPPHIIFIVADDLGWNDVGWHNPEIHTPDLDKLAHSGVILNSSYVQYICTPTRSCFMTGRYPFHTGMQHNVIWPKESYYLPTKYATLPEKLKHLGYSTHIIGKWHLGHCNWRYTPTYRGFDSFFGFLGGSEDYFNHITDNLYDFRFNTSVFHPPKDKYSAELFADRAIDIITTTDPESQPLYLYIAFQSVHGPLQPKDENRSIKTDSFMTKQVQGYAQVPKQYENLYSNIKSFRRRTYCRMVSALDDAVGKITDALTARGFMDNALMVFTTDNGGRIHLGGNNFPLRGGKTTLWEGGTKGVAFVYSHSLLKKTRYVNNELLHAVDWFPTILSLAGGVPDFSLDGVDQWQTISEGARSSRYEIVYNIDEIDNKSAIRVGKYKMVQGENCYAWGDASGYFLFDLEEDPFEHNNIADQQKHILEELKQRLNYYRKSLVPSRKLMVAHAVHPLFNHVLTPGWC